MLGLNNFDDGKKQKLFDGQLAIERIERVRLCFHVARREIALLTHIQGDPRLLWWTGVSRQGGPWGPVDPPGAHGIFWGPLGSLGAPWDPLG